MIFIQVLNKVIVINYNLHRFNDVKFLFILRSVLPASKRRILPSDPPVPKGDEGTHILRLRLGRRRVGMMGAPLTDLPPGYILVVSLEKRQKGLSAPLGHTRSSPSISFFVWRAAKVCFLYIGTVIGAGFASGREIALFFEDTAPLGVALAALFMAVPQALFLIAGKTGALPSGTVVKTGVFLAAFSSVAAMLAGCETALADLTGVAGTGVVAAVAAGLLVTGGTEKMKLANAVLIPLLLALLLLIYLKCGTPLSGGSFSLLKPVHYAGLDVLMGGMIISREGKRLGKREILFICAMSALFLGIVLFVLQNIVLSDKMNSSMPVLAVAEKVGLKTAAGVLIVIAVFTTLVSSLDILTENLRGALSSFASAGGGAMCPARRAAAFLAAPSHRALAVFFCLAALYPVSFFGFENIVDTLYPFVGLCGVGMTVLTAYELLRRALRGSTLSSSDGDDPSGAKKKRSEERFASAYHRGGEQLSDDGRDSRSPRHRTRRRGCRRSRILPPRRPPRPRGRTSPRRENGGCPRARPDL